MSASNTPAATTPTRFTHQRLDAYRVAVEVFLEVERIAAGFPAGHAELKDQVRRAAAATVRNIAEGANRLHARDKAARFAVARGEIGECDAALEMVQLLGLAPWSQVDRVRLKADRVAAMVWGLVRRLRE